MCRLLICLAVALTVVARGQENGSCTNSFAFEFREGLLWVEVRVPESSRVLNFLLDTGAEVSVLDLQTAKSLCLKVGARAEVRGVHVSTQGYWSGTKSASAGTVSLPNRFLVLDLAQLSDSCERNVDGLIGLDFFRSKVVQICFSDAEVRLLNPEVRQRAAKEGVPLEVRRCGMCVKASIGEEKPAWVRVDTGCASGLQWVVGRPLPEGCTSKVAVGLAALGIPQTRTTVKIGGHTFTNVETGLHDAAIFEGESGMVGNGLLGQFRTVTIDTITGRLTLETRQQSTAISVR